MSSNHESLHIIQNSVQNIILERILSQINDKIQLQNLNKKVPIFGKQKIRKFIPKIIETAAFNLKIHGKTRFLEDHLPQSPMIKFQRKSRKSHNGDVSQKTSQALNNFQTKSNWFQSQVESKRQKVGEKLESKLIKLDIGREKQDEFIVRKRLNFQRKEIIQKRLQTISDYDKLSNILSSINSSYEKQATSTSHSYTTDYNGDLIKFKSSSKQRKNVLKQQNFHQVKQEQTFVKQKSNVKVKITTFVENIHLKPTKILNFEQAKNRNIQEIQRESSDLFQLNEKNCNKVFQRKTLKYQDHSLDYFSIIKNLELSPGVTLQSIDCFQKGKQNDDCISIAAVKSFGKLIGKKSKDIAYDYLSETTRSEIKPKKSNQKRYKFAEMQNFYE